MKIFIAIPAINESEYISNTIDCIRKQKTDCEFEVFVCVNQPDDLWDENNSKLEICYDNQKTISYLKGINDIPITIIDKSSKGRGWEKGKDGVGWARKLLMDTIIAKAKDEDLIISMDADTSFGKHYFRSLKENFIKHSDAKGICVPYYHELTGDVISDRAILRYEIYMRYFLLNLIRIGSPYSFTALGSAIAFPVASYRALRGITPKNSGEDFYLMQKLCKYGKVLIWNKECVKPSGRYSDRVLFGTGPALIKGSAGDWESYPIYDYKLFDEIYVTYSLFPFLFEKNVETPLLKFCNVNDGLLDELRRHNKDLKRFIRACHTKVDALRILQYIKSKHKGFAGSDETNLKSFLSKFYNESIGEYEIDLNGLSFADSDIKELNKLRDFLFETELKLRKEKDNN